MVLNQLGQQLTGAFQKLTQGGAQLDDEALKAVLKDISAALLQADVPVMAVQKLRKAVMDKVGPIVDGGVGDKARLVERIVFDELVRMLDPGKEAFKPKKGKTNVIMFVGLQGAGKTTTVAKYAHYYQQRKFKVAMVCADTFRAGAFDQLKQNATRVRVPFYGSYTEPDPVKIAAEGVAQFRKEGYNIIIVDTSGRHMQETALFAEMEQVSEAVQPDEVIFVMDGSIGQAAQAQAAAFRKSVAVGSVIVTKLDGHAKGGGALSAVAATGSPIIFLGTGEHFDALDAFDARRFVGKLLGRGDMQGLALEMKEKGMMEKPEVLKMMKEGKMSLRDFKDQLTTVMGMGSLSKIAEMMPGPMASMMQANGGGEVQNKMLKRQLIILDSMTAEELDGGVELNESRAKRICIGAGAHPQELNQLMGGYRQMEKMVGGMSKSGLLSNDAALEKAMKRDPKAVMAQLQKTMDPAMLAKMGGAGGMFDMLKAFEGTELGGKGGGGRGGRAGGRGGRGGAAGRGGGNRLETLQMD